MARIRSSLVCAALLLVLAAPSADASRAKREQRVVRILKKAGYERVKAHCPPDRRRQCRYAAFRANEHGALDRCRGRAKPTRRRVRIKRRSCAPMRAAAPLPELGFNGVAATEPAELGAVTAIGGTAARMSVSWALSERNEGSFDFSQAMPAYERLVASGLRPVIIVGNSPRWARSAELVCGSAMGCSYPPNREYDWAWQRFIKAVIAEFPEARGIEVWNEPNWDLMWSSGADPERYAELVTLADRAAAETVADPPIVFAGLYTGGGLIHSIEPAEFLRRAYARGLSYDVLGIHSYPMRRPGFAAAAIAEIEELWSVAASFGDRPDSWLTELGISTGGPSWFRADEEEQARSLVEIYRWAQRSRRIPLIIVHKLRDALDIDGADWGTHLGLRRADGTPKPAFCALASLRSRPCA